MRTLLFVAAFLPCIFGLLVSVALASQVYNSTSVKEPAPQGANKDAAVTSIVQDGPPFVNEGSTVIINIGVSNNGTEQATFTVSLRDDTGNELIGSLEVTLAAAGSTTISIGWDTEGATGGPPPPGPPTPGTIHALTAFANLAGDTVESNNSMSLLPGIWVIAAPEPSGITFPDSYKEPEARTSSGLGPDTPSLHTVAEALAETYVGPVSGQQDIAFSDPSIATAPKTLANIYSSEVKSDKGFSFAKPEINTVVESLSTISSDGLDNRLDMTINAPAIGTSATPLSTIFLYRSKPGDVILASDPMMTTKADALAQIFTASISSKEVVGLTKPGIDTGTGAADRIVSDISQADLMKVLAEPEVDTGKGPLLAVFDSPTDADAGGVLTMGRFETATAELDDIFRTRVQASQLHQGTEPEFAIQSESVEPPQPNPVEGIGDPDPPIVGLTEAATIRGRIKLQGRISSLGSYVEIGSAVTFADRQGYFQIQRQAGSFDLTVMAPGYLSRVIDRINLEPGDVFVVPVVTLPFGDVDGDGAIDIYDLTVAARNYGRTAPGVWFR